MRKLKKEFIGRGEVGGFQFKQIKEGPKYYVYEVTDSVDNNLKYYELVKKTYNRQFDCESYPGSKGFGLNAWTYATLELLEEGIKKHFGDTGQ